MKENNNYRIKFCDKLGVTIDKMKIQIITKDDEKKKQTLNLLLNAPNTVGIEESLMSESKQLSSPSLRSPQTPTTPSNENKNKEYLYVSI